MFIFFWYPGINSKSLRYKFVLSGFCTVILLNGALDRVNRVGVFNFVRGMKTIISLNVKVWIELGQIPLIALVEQKNSLRFLNIFFGYLTKLLLFLAY